MSNSSAQFSLTCVNNSNQPWTFYMYQKVPGQPYNVFSLAWLTSPFQIMPNGGTIRFTWQTDYIFVWANTGPVPVQPGVIFNTAASIPCNPTAENQTTFSMNQGMPQFAAPTSGGRFDYLTIHEASNVPNSTLATGIGMSGQATFIQQAFGNQTQMYSTGHEYYYIAAAPMIQKGEVLSSNIHNVAQINFESGVYNKTATLGENNQWTITD